MTTSISNYAVLAALLIGSVYGKSIGSIIVFGPTSPSVYGQTLTYTCYPNDTIIATNPDSSLYTGAFANDTDAICTVVTGASITTTGCSQDDDILLVLSNRTTTGDNILGGKAKLVYQIKCNDIDASGVTKTALVGFTPSIDPAVQSSVTPSFDVGTFIRSSSSATDTVDTALIGTQQVWTVEVPSEYVARPAFCYAVSGTNAFDSSALRVNLTEDGCSEDEDLTHDFTGNTTVGTKYRLYADFFVFKFYNSDFITIHCNVLLCLSDSASPCAVSCPGRKRREAIPDAPAFADLGTSTTLRVTQKLDESSGAEHKGPYAVFTVIGCFVAMATVLT